MAHLNEGEAFALMAQGELGASAVAPSWLCLKDDYAWWKDGGCLPSRGKPLWYSPHDDRHHPIFFDGNALFTMHRKEYAKKELFPT